MSSYRQENDPAYPFSDKAQEQKLSDIQKRFFDSAEYAYHITKPEYLESIFEKGLLPNTETGNCNFHDISRAGVVYVMTDKNMTLRMGHFITCSGELVLIKIKKDKLDSSKVSDDSNLDFDDGLDPDCQGKDRDRWRTALCYHGKIPPEAFENVEIVDCSNIRYRD